MSRTRARRAATTTRATGVSDSSKVAQTTRHTGEFEQGSDDNGRDESVKRGQGALRRAATAKAIRGAERQRRPRRGVCGDLNQEVTRQ